jgi:hypothetical protein
MLLQDVREYAAAARDRSCGRWQVPPSEVVPLRRYEGFASWYVGRVAAGGSPPSRLRRFGGTDFACRELAWYVGREAPDPDEARAKRERSLAGRQGFEPR